MNKEEVIERISNLKAFLYRKTTVKITEKEAKEKYPIFRWVSLEELENEI